MLPSWSEFWGRIGECWSKAGEAIAALGVFDTLLWALALVVSLAIYGFAVFMLANARSGVRDEFCPWDLSPLAEGLTIALLYLGQAILTLIYVLVSYGIWGTVGSVRNSLIAAAVIGLLWEVVFRKIEHEDDKIRRAHSANKA